MASLMEFEIMKKYLNLIISIAICFGQLTAMDSLQEVNSDQSEVSDQNRRIEAAYALLAIAPACSSS